MSLFDPEGVKQMTSQGKKLQLRSNRDEDLDVEIISAPARDGCFKQLQESYLC